MASKKISWWYANIIGQKVAEKAFEHLIAPLKTVLDTEAKEIYDSMTARAGLDDAAHVAYLHSIDIITMSMKCEVRVETPEGYVSNTLNAEGGSAGFVSSRITVPLGASDVDVDPLIQATRLAKPVQEAQVKLADRVCGDITGKSTTFVAKTWPEISGIVAGVTGETVSPLEVPFENLIHKYVSPFMALPAPQTV